MAKRKMTRMLVVAATMVAAGWLGYPSFDFYRRDASGRAEIVARNPGIMKRIFSLGLDLQGGMMLVLELDPVEAGRGKGEVDALDRVYTVIANRINALGVAEPTIQKRGRTRLIVELPGLRNPRIAREVVGSTARLEFRIVEDIERFDKAVAAIARVVGRTAGSPLLDSGLTGDDGTARDSLGMDGDPEVTALDEVLFGGGAGSYCAYATQVPFVDSLLRTGEVRGALAEAGAGNARFLWGTESEDGPDGRRDLYMVRSKAELYGDAVTDARAFVSTGGNDAGQWKVEVRLDGKGAAAFARLTARNVGRQLAIVLDDRVYSAPVIREKIPGGIAEISGGFSAEEAKAIAVVIRAGALPVPVSIVEERIVGPSLGQDSIRYGVRAGIVGMLAIFLYMAWYYRASGMYANIALLLNLFYVLAAMAGLCATLTLPGIAGLILNLGMAVDANVLVCERIREELRVGKRIWSAIDVGYSRAMLTIVDSNLTTLIAAAMLFWIGTGPIRGFAVTLGLGVAISMFTSLFVTRVMYDLFTNSQKQTLSI